MLGPCPSPFLALVRGYMVAALSSSFLSVRVVVLLGSLLPVAMFVVLMPGASFWRTVPRSREGGEIGSHRLLAGVAETAPGDGPGAHCRPSLCSLDAGCAGFYAGGRHSVARGGTCAASGGG